MDAETYEAHPVAEFIAQLLQEGGPGEEIVVMTSQARAMLEELVDEYARAGTPELMYVAQTMYSLADRLEEKNAQSAADALVMVLNRSNVIGAMQMINEQLRNHLGALEHGTPGDEFASFATRNTDRRAPAIGETAPDDAVKLGSLDFPKRL
jgi:hypothetical protein